MMLSSTIRTLMGGTLAPLSIPPGMEGRFLMSRLGFFGLELGIGDESRGGGATIPGAIASISGGVGGFGVGGVFECSASTG